MGLGKPSEKQNNFLSKVPLAVIIDENDFILTGEQALAEEIAPFKK